MYSRQKSTKGTSTDCCLPLKIQKARECSKNDERLWPVTLSVQYVTFISQWEFLTWVLNWIKNNWIFNCSTKIFVNKKNVIALFGTTIKEKVGKIKKGEISHENLFAKKIFKKRLRASIHFIFAKQKHHQWGVFYCKCVIRLQPLTKITCVSSRISPYQIDLMWFQWSNNSFMSFTSEWFVHHLDGIKFHEDFFFDVLYNWILVWN